MNITRFGFLLFALILSIHRPAYVFAAPGNTGKLRVGVILPLSGEAASIGQAMINGMTMAYDKLPPEAKNRLELVYEDDGMKPANTISAYRKLSATDTIDVFVNASSGTANALAPLAEQDKVPLVAVATDPKVVAGRNYVVSFWVSPEEEIRRVIPEALKRGYKKLARISTMHDFPLEMKRQFDRENKGRFELVLDEEFAQDNKDFRTFLVKLKEKKADAILVALMPGQLGVFAKQAKQLGNTLPIFGFETLEDANEVKVSEGALVGHWYVNTDDPNEKFLDEYKAAYPGDSVFGASNAHDIVLVLGAAAEKGLDSEGVNRFLHTLKDFSGALGTYSATNDNRFTLPAAIKVVTAEGFKKLY